MLPWRRPMRGGKERALASPSAHDLVGHNDLLHLVGALVDLGDLGIAKELLDGVLAHAWSSLRVGRDHRFLNLPKREDFEWARLPQIIGSLAGE
jgi:hypothetical protein